MLTDVAEIHFLEYPKFRRLTEKNFKDNAIERWLAFLEKDISEETLKELVQMEPAIQKAESKLEHLSSDEETMSIYYAREKSLHDQANMINTAEQRGRNQRNVEIAKKMLLAGMDLEMIRSITELSISEIQTLKDSDV